MDIRIGNTIMIKVSPATIGETNFDNIKSIKAVFIRKENEQPQSCNPAPYCSRNNIYPCYNVQPYNTCYCNNTCECCSEQAEYEDKLDHDDLVFTDGFVHFTFPANKQSHCGEYLVKLSAVIGNEDTDEENCLSLCMNTGIEFNLTCGGSMGHGVGKSYTFTLGEGSSSTDPDDPVVGKKNLYLGMGDEDITTFAEIEALTDLVHEQISKLTEKEFVINNTVVNKYIWFCSQLPISSIQSSNFDVPYVTKADVNGYYCYRTEYQIKKLTTNRFKLI